MDLSHEHAFALLRISVGAFFAISGFHKLVIPERHDSLVQTFKELKIPFIRFNEWFVPFVEFIAGVCFAVGLGHVISGLLLGAICLVATLTDGVKRIKAWKPIDKADCIDDILYLPEVLYGIIIISVIIGGPGAWTV